MVSRPCALALHTVHELKSTPSRIIANTQGGVMKNKLNRPWLTASGVERPLDELKEISKSWDEQTWNEYLNWYQSGNSEKLVSNNVFSKVSEELEKKNIFENFGYQSCPELRSFCDQLLRSVPEFQQQILRSIFFEGMTQREVAFDIKKSAGCIAQNKTKAITTLKRVHGEELVSARQYMRGTEVFEPEKIKSLWDQKLSHQIKDQRSYDQLNANQELLNHCVADIREIFQKLSEVSRQIIYLKFWCELSTSEIARKLSVGLNIVEQIIDATVFNIKSQLVQNITEDLAAA